MHVNQEPLTTGKWTAIRHLAIRETVVSRPNGGHIKGSP